MWIRPSLPVEITQSVRKSFEVSWINNMIWRQAENECGTLSFLGVFMIYIYMFSLKICMSVHIYASIIKNLGNNVTESPEYIHEFIYIYIYICVCVCI